MPFLAGAVLLGASCSPTSPENAPPSLAAPNSPADARVPEPTRRVAVRVLYRGRAPFSPLPSSPGDPLSLGNQVEAVCLPDAGGFARAIDFSLPGVVVWVSSPTGPRPSASSEPRVVRLEHCRFDPPRIAVAVGSRLRFVNEDPILHSLVAVPEVNPRFDAGLPFPGMSADLLLPSAELGVRIRSRRFPWMTAVVAVVNSSWFAVTGEDGSAVLVDPPAGPLSISAWHPDLGTVRLDLEAPAEGDLPAELWYPESALADEIERREEAAR